jgi:hypothetical protein
MFYGDFMFEFIPIRFVFIAIHFLFINYFTIHLEKKQFIFFLKAC